MPSPTFSPGCAALAKNVHFHEQSVRTPRRHQSQWGLIAAQPNPITDKERTPIMQGDRDPLYPVKISAEMAKAIPNSSLWIIPGASRGSVIVE